MRRSIIGGLVLFAFAAGTGTAADNPKFEVASVKPAGPGPQMTLAPALKNGTMRAVNVTLRQVLMEAYGLTEPRVIGPDWLDKNRFDLSAKSPEGVPDSAMKPMLQALLKDRFKLAAHLETREVPVYHLLVAKGGVKMSVYPSPPRPDIPRPDGVPLPMMRATIRMPEFAELLSGVAGRPVLDQTGLTERYDFSLIYAPMSARPEGNPTDVPDLFAALQEQLGLRLQTGKGNLQVVVVDHMERMPSEN